MLPLMLIELQKCCDAWLLKDLARILFDYIFEPLPIRHVKTLLPGLYVNHANIEAIIEIHEIIFEYLNYEHHDYLYYLTDWNYHEMGITIREYSSEDFIEYEGDNDSRLVLFIESNKVLYCDKYDNYITDMPSAFLYYDYTSGYLIQDKSVENYAISIKQFCIWFPIKQWNPPVLDRCKYQSIENKYLTNDISEFEFIKLTREPASLYCMILDQCLKIEPGTWAYRTYRFNCYGYGKYNVSKDC